MAEKKSPDPETRKNFEDFLATCPSADAPAAGVVVAGMVLRSAKEGSFVLRTADEAQHEVPVEAVEDFRVLGGPAGVRLAQLSLNPERLEADLAAALGRAQTPGGGPKPPFDKLLPTDKFPPGDKFPPFDKLPPLDKQPPLRHAFAVFRAEALGVAPGPTDRSLPMELVEVTSIAGRAMVTGVAGDLRFTAVLKRPPAARLTERIHVVLPETPSAWFAASGARLD